MGSNPTTSAKQPPSLPVGNTDGGFPYVLTHNATLASILASDADPKHKLIQEDQPHPTYTLVVLVVAAEKPEQETLRHTPCVF